MIDGMDRPEQHEQTLQKESAVFIYKHARHPHSHTSLIQSTRTAQSNVQTTTHSIIMSIVNANIPYIQSLWKSNNTKPAAPFTTPFSMDIPNKSLERVGTVSAEIQRKDKLQTTSMRKVSRATLGEQIHIGDPDVVDLSLPEFWSRHLQIVKASESTNSNSSANSEGTSAAAAAAAAGLVTVTLVMGSLDRDRVDEKTCALYHSQM